MLFKRSLVSLLISMAATSSWSAADLQQLDDAALSQVAGQDGVALALKNFSLRSEAGHLGYTKGLTLTYTMPNDGDANFERGLPYDQIHYSNYDISRTDPADVFADPYQIQVVSTPFPAGMNPADWLAPNDPILTESDPGSSVRGRTKLDVIQILNPKNLDGAMKWNMAYDWKVVTDVDPLNPTTSGVTHDMGARIVEDMVMYGGGISLLPAWSRNNAKDVKGAAFGLDLHMAISKLILRPRGRADSGTEMVLSGIRIGAANATKTGVDTDPTKTWRMADVFMQPGLITSEVGEDGKSVLRMGIEWYRGPDGTDAPVGAFSIDNISIKNGPASAPVTTNLGGVSIGGMQIRYLDVVFRNPN